MQPLKWLYFSVLYRVQYLYIKSRMFGSKHKSSDDGAGTGKKCQELEALRKDEGRQEEEITEELKRFMMQEMARGFSLFEEALLVFKVQDLNLVHEGCSSRSECNPALLCHL